MNATKHKRDFAIRTIDRVADRVDLAIDLLTLGEYGLERNAGGAGCEGIGHRSAAGRWEAPAQPRRRGACEWPWPNRARCLP